MDVKKQENLTADDAGSLTPQAAAERERYASRRQMLKAALVAAPLFMTLKGKPAFGQSAGPQSLGSLGIFYGNYVQDDQGNWKAADGDGNILNDQSRRTNSGTVAPPPPTNSVPTPPSTPVPSVQLKPKKKKH